MSLCQPVVLEMFFTKLRSVTLAFFTGVDLHRATLHLAQSDPDPRAAQPFTSPRATLHLAQSDPAPCPERPCASRRANLHLAQSEPAPCAERTCTSRRARKGDRAERGGVLALTSRSASCLLALREGEMNLQNRLALFFSDVWCLGIVLGRPLFQLVGVPLCFGMVLG